MDHLLEIATHLLRQMPVAAKDGLADKPTLTLLRSDLDGAVARAHQRRDAAARQFRERKTVTAEKEQAQADPPESAPAAPGILRTHLLADLLARTPTLIPKALDEACGHKRRFYPTYLEYLMVSVEEILDPPFGRHGKWFAIREHKALLWDRRERVVAIVERTSAWKQCQASGQTRGSGTPPSAASASDAGGGFTASMLGAGDLSSRTAKMRERGRRAAKSLIDTVSGSHEPLRDVRDLFERDDALIEQFRTALREELLITPDLVRELSAAAAIAVPFEVALHEELREIRQSRAARRIDPLGDDAATHATRLSSDMNTLGLALSGGGIRSATFNLGVLQGLAHCDLLRRVDYLSTVSGGGYIGAWLASWSKRILRDERGDRRGVDLVQERLSTEPLTEPDALSVRAVRFLREYSNYLTPQAGVFTADTWTMIAIWLRNTLLNQAVLILTLCAILGVPWMLWVFQSGLTPQTSLAAGLHAFRPCRPGLFATSPLVMTSAAVLLLYASAIAGQQLRRFGLSGFNRRLTRDDTLAQTGVLTGIVAPAVVSAALISVALFNVLGCNTPVFTRRSVLELGAVFAASMIIFAVGGHYHHCFIADRVSTSPTRQSRTLAYLSVAFVLGIGILLSSVGGSAVVIKLTALLGERLRQSGATPGSLSLAFVAFGPPVLIATFSLMIVIKIGILGRNLFDEHREWWSRLGAWLNIVSIAWMLLCALALFSPQLVWAIRSRSAHYVAASGGVLWAVWTAAGVLWGKAESFTKPGEGGTSQRMRTWIVAAAPYSFILGLLILLSATTFAAVSNVAPGDLRPSDLRTVHALGWPHRTWMLVTPPALLLAAILLSWRVDINEFSMHNFYKNRLVRCYLGASRDRRADRPERTPDPFTGFDAADDLKLAFFRSNPREDSQTFLAKRADNIADAFPYVGPLPIINTALNLVKGDDLAWQERRAQSFVFTPFFSGYDQRRREAVDPIRAPYGFRPTALFGYPPFGTGLGTAVAISGAAASPNMGYHSSPPAAFLMTMFNARLGWWMGNPRNNRAWLRSGPRRGLLYLVNELFGLTNDRTPFINLSDGGHFENLGIYELVRRRCRYIIASDAEQDASLHFNGLGNAIRKCRTDFGAEIEISAIRIRPAQGLLSPLHCVIGDITYADGEKGTLLYLKASVTGDEPADVLEYAARETTFPHHSTITDQFFDESQFESYRKLGFHVARTAFASPTRTAKTDLPAGAGTHDQLAAVFAHMRDYWHPANPVVADRRAAHAEQYDALLSRVMDGEFSFADSAFFAGLGSAGTVQRPALFVGALMLDLMQRVYLDLDLENDRDHPHNSGWITIFKRWKRHPAVVDAWTASQDDYSRPFRWFYGSL